jgi:hypothetical protein
MSFTKIPGPTSIVRPGTPMVYAGDRRVILNNPATEILGQDGGFAYDLFIGDDENLHQIELAFGPKGVLSGRTFSGGIALGEVYRQLTKRGYVFGGRGAVPILEIERDRIRIDVSSLWPVAESVTVVTMQSPPCAPTTSVAPMPTPEQYISALNMRVNGKSVKAIASELGCDPLAIQTYLEEKIEAYVALSSVNRIIWRADELTRLRKEAK